MTPRDTTFVVQGPIDRSISPLTGQPATKSCLESIRKYHKGARVILSTWKHEPVDNLDYDEIVLSDDPGQVNCARPDSGQVVPDNLNRQIVSSKNGLSLVTTEYAVKMRSDLIFAGNNWMRYFGKFPLRSRDWRVFRDRVITTSLFTRDPRCPFVSYPMHPSDWFHAGRAEDIKLLWDIDLPPEPESSQWFLTRPQPPAPIDLDGIRYDLEVRRFYPEQYIWRTLLMKCGPLDFEDRGSQSPELTRLTELSFANNLIVLDMPQLPLISHKYPFPHFNPPRRRYRVITHQDWKWLYSAYCANRPVETALHKLSTRHFYLKKAYDASFAPLQMLREIRQRVQRA